MDLRPYPKSEQQMARLRAVVASTDFMYQPFIIDDAIEVGGGYEFIFNRIGAGMVHWPECPQDAPVRSRIIDPALAPDFRLANGALRSLYDQWADAIATRAKETNAQSVMDFGCFNGYIPTALALRGVKRSVGYDIHDRGACVSVLNDILNVNAEFHVAGYDLTTGLLPRSEQFDIVSCMSVLQHISEPMRFISMLASITKDALFLMTNVWSDDDLLIRYGPPNTVFNFRFPWCFDNGMYMSEKLLRLALSEAGFHTIIPVPLTYDQSVFARAAEVSTTEAPPVEQLPEAIGVAKGELRGINWMCLRNGPSVADPNKAHALAQR